MPAAYLSGQLEGLKEKRRVLHRAVVASPPCYPATPQQARLIGSAIMHIPDGQLRHLCHDASHGLHCIDDGQNVVAELQSSAVEGGHFDWLPVQGHGLTKCPPCPLGSAALRTAQPPSLPAPL